MSSHQCDAWMGQQRVSVLLGWDRALAGHFLVVEATPVDESNDNYVYSNLDDAALTRWMGVPPDLNYFVEKLRSMGINVPERMLEEVAADKRNNVGNRKVIYNERGELA